MTVTELIAKLQTLPPHLPVVIYDYDEKNEWGAYQELSDAAPIFEDITLDGAIRDKMTTTEILATAGENPTAVELG